VAYPVWNSADRLLFSQSDWFFKHFTSWEILLSQRIADKIAVFWDMTLYIMVYI
jgi:hypothetical protein